MKTKCILLLLALGFARWGFGQGTFTNLGFESARVVVNDPTFGFLDWNLAAPGWSHSSGSDLGIVYYRNEHLGLTGYYMLYDSVSPAFAPGTQLAGRYSLGFSSGYANSGFGAPWQQNYLSQTGSVASDIQSFRLLARGSFDVLMGGAAIPMQSLGGDLYAGDISAFAGTTTEFRIVNTATTIHTPVIVDNITFSPIPVPEPSMFALVGMGAMAWLIVRRRTRPPVAAPAQVGGHTQRRERFRWRLANLPC